MMAVAWGGICCSDPPCVAISLRKATYSYGNIMQHKAFTLNVPSERYVDQADYVGIYSGRSENKFETTGLTPVPAENVHAPYIEEFPLNLICKVIHVTEIGLHTQFVGEVVDSLADESILNDKGLPIIEKVNPFIYDSATRSYFGIGGKLTGAYSNVKE